VRVGRARVTSPKGNAAFSEHDRHPAGQKLLLRLVRSDCCIGGGAIQTQLPSHRSTFTYRLPHRGGRRAVRGVFRVIGGRDLAHGSHTVKKRTACAHIKGTRELTTRTNVQSTCRQQTKKGHPPPPARRRETQRHRTLNTGPEAPPSRTSDLYSTLESKTMYEL
jgi:hypothetical protein